MHLYVAWALLGVAGFALVFFLGGLLLVVHHLKQGGHSVAADKLPPVSLVKPLKGVEEGLAENLASLYEQEYPQPFEVVFATATDDDVALPVAREVAARFPNVPTRFVLSDVAFGLNPKVANLTAAVDAAKYDLVLQSDANVRVRKSYLREVISEFVSKDASLLSSMVVGVGERSIGAAMENLQLSAFISPATCVALYVAKITCVIGKSILFRKSELASFGGLAAFKDYLAEDFLLGAAYEKAGKKVILSGTPAENVNVDASIARFMGRHSRWLKMRAVIDLRGFVGDFFANSVSFAFLAMCVSLFDPRFVIAFGSVVVAKMALDALMVRRTRGHAMSLAHLWVAPFKDLLMGGIWFYATLSRSVEWRGVKLHLEAMSHLRPYGGPLIVRKIQSLRPQERSSTTKENRHV